MLNKDNIDQLLLKHLLQENAVEEEQSSKIERMVGTRS